jgi:crotonobetainyl-CoA:carnitine CoA-transferase CaiB-like acyl-CoA transferase
VLKLLPDLRVVEIGDSIAVAYAGRLLADLGAEVMALEPPAGNRLRTDPRLAPHLAGFLNANKLSATIDFAAVPDETLARSICRGADVILYDGSVAYLNQRLLAEGLYQQSDVVLTLVSPWGLSSPHAGLCNDELLFFALSGIASVTPEEPEDPLVERPMQLYGHQAQFAGGLTAAVAALQGWFAARKSGRSQLLDVPVLDALISMPIVSQAATFAGHPLPQGPSLRPQTVPRGFLRCREGYVYTQGGDDNWSGWAQLLERPDWDAPPFSEPSYREQHWPVIGAAIQRWLDERANDAVYLALQQKGITAFPVNAIPQVVAHRQVEARAIFGAIRQQDGAEFLAPRTPFRVQTPEMAPEPDIVHRLGADRERVCAALGLEATSASFA